MNILKLQSTKNWPQYLTTNLLLTAIILMLGCSDSPPQGSASMGNIMGQQSSGFAPVLDTTEIRFPADHNAHDDYRLEWWYLTANLKTASGEPIGVQWTQFRIAMSPPQQQSSDSGESSAWATNQLYMAHSALTSKQSHLASERWSRQHNQLAGTTAKPFSVVLDNWQWRASGEDLFPATLSVTDPQYRYELKLTTQAPYQLQGNNGYSIKDPTGEVASHYYSQPFIDVSGWIERHGEQVAVTGQAWLDREWSSQFLKDNQQGWDWFALRLDDGSALMVFQLRGQPNFYSARRMFADGTGHAIANEDIQLSPIGWHKINNQDYPVKWQVSIASEQIALEVSPLNANALQPLTVNYWEGPVNATGSHTAQGYMELTGY